MRELKLLTGRTVVVATPDTAIRGTLGAVSKNFVELVEAHAVDGPNPVPIVGSAWVPVVRLSYVQVVA